MVSACFMHRLIGGQAFASAVALKALSMTDLTMRLGYHEDLARKTQTENAHAVTSALQPTLQPRPTVSTD